MKCYSTDILKKMGFKQTKGRLDVLDLIISFDSPFTVNMIHSRLENGMDIANIYRFIRALENGGVVRGVTSIAGEAYFEYICKHHPVHSHFVCRICRKIICLDGCSIKIEGSDTAFDAESVVVTGICDVCRKQQQ